MTPNKALHIILHTVATMLLLTACTAESVLPDGQGTLRLQLAQVSTHTTTRATPKELGAPTQERFHIKAVRQSSGDTAYDGPFTPELTLHTGRYELTATCGEDVPIGRDTPFYTGTATATVEKDQQSQATIACKVGNALVSAVFGRDAEERARFDKYYSSYGLMVAVGNYSMPISADDATSSIYFPAGSTVTLTFYGTLRNDDGREVSTPLTHESLPAPFQAADHAIVTLTLPNPENVLAVNIEKVEVESVTIEESIPLSWLPIPKATATHHYDQAGDLQGTDLIFSNSYPEMEWKAVVTNEQGDEVRAVSGKGELTSDYNSSTDWPYLPAGKYKATYYLLEGETANRTGSREFTIGQPQLAITLDGYTSHSRYAEGHADEANALDGHTVYAPQARVNIASQLTSHSRYGYQMAVIFDGQTQQAGGNTVQLGNQTRQARQEPYTLQATASFAGMNLEAKKNWQVTGLPLRSTPPTEAQGWKAESDYVTWSSTEVKLGNRGGWITHYNESIIYNDIAIPTGTKLTVDYNLSIAVYGVSTTFTCNIDEGSILSFSGANTYQGQIAHTTTVPTTYIQCHNSYGGGSTYTTIYSLNLTYGQ